MVSAKEQKTVLTIHTKSYSRSEAEALSRELNMRLYRTSVKDDLNVSVVFQHLAENYVNKVSDPKISLFLGATPHLYSVSA